MNHDKSILLAIHPKNKQTLSPLFAIGVFISFTLSQTGMLVRWLMYKEDGWQYKSLINGLGALVTFVTVLIIGYTKIHLGAWMVIVLIPLLVYGMIVTKEHYADVASQLKLSLSDIEKETEIIAVQKFVIVLVDSLNKGSLKAINYAINIAEDTNVTAFNVSTDLEQGEN